MNKKVIGLTVIICVGIAVGIWLSRYSKHPIAPSSELPGQKELLTATDDDIRPGDASPHIPASLEPLDVSVSPVECQKLLSQEERIEEELKREINKQMWALYQHGESPMTLATARAAEDFHSAKEFYQFVTLSQELLTQQAYFEQTEHGRKLWEKLQRELKAADEGYFGWDVLQQEIQSFWESELPSFSPAQTTSPEAVEALIAQVSAFSGPSHWLSTFELNPAKNLLGYLMIAGEWKSANLVLDAFPGLISSPETFSPKINGMALNVMQFSLNQNAVASLDFQSLWQKVTAGAPPVMDLQRKRFMHGKFSNSISKLEQLGLSFPVVDARDYGFVDESGLLKFDGENSRQNFSLEQCKERLAWFKDREFNASELERKIEHPFIRQVQKSPESAYCEHSRDNKVMDEFASEFHNIVAQYREQLINAQSLTDIPLDNMLEGVDSETFRGMALLSLNLVLSFQFEQSEVEIADWMMLQGYMAKAESMPMFVGVIPDNAWTFWSDQIEWTESQIKRSLLAAAETGSAGIYDHLSINKQSAQWQGSEVDPLYLAIQHYNPLGFEIQGSPRDSKKLLQQLESLGTPIQAHHQRALYQMQQLQPELYQQLIADHPRLTLTEVPEYFSVTCDQ